MAGFCCCGSLELSSGLLDSSLEDLELAGASLGADIVGFFSCMDVGGGESRKKGNPGGGRCLMLVAVALGCGLGDDGVYVKLGLFGKPVVKEVDDEAWITMFCCWSYSYTLKSSALLPSLLVVTTVPYRLTCGSEVKGHVHYDAA